MNKVYETVLKAYGHDEPVFYEELRKHLVNMSDVAFRQNIKRLTDDGKLLRVKNGIYYVPKKNSVLKSPKPNIDKVVKRKYIQTFTDEIVGYISGINFANLLGLTTQTASISTIVTNETASNSKTRIEIGRKSIIIKKPKVKITNENYKMLQVLDLLTEYERLSEKPLDAANSIFLTYLKEVYLPYEEVEKLEGSYSKKVFCKAVEMRLFDEITSRKGSI